MKNNRIQCIMRKNNYLKAGKKMEQKKKINYWVIAFLYGLVCSTIPIIITEIIWDNIANLIGLSGFSRELIGDFLRAALLEEAFKFLGFWLSDKRYRFTRERDYMLAAGTIGLVYGVVEKIVTLNPFAIILGIVFPMHILWQMNQGRHFYAYRTAKAQGDQKTARHELFLSTGMIFLLHGCWDAIVGFTAYFINDSKISGAEIMGGLLLAATVTFGVIYTVCSIKQSVRVIRKSKNDVIEA